MVEKKESYKLIKIPIQESLAFQNSEGDILSLEEAILEILNKLERLEKELIGK